jgi:hypothetical protein
MLDHSLRCALHQRDQLRFAPVYGSHHLARRVEGQLGHARKLALQRVLALSGNLRRREQGDFGRITLKRRGRIAAHRY